ncbi:hypothetical protein GCM10011375_40630 [Hymenobacter qilianensis]|uniref:Uncharacterized protein n=2 Tax=Hymenobacter qilianensis TaxID=1385715 RepID=A0ACB5PXB5_9BACT|nr:DUF3703 domain-containing protein [Hymenobacter qilianensis]QNP54469.1 DUF3703 domain-containing protein [Hymenobacter qilianensis]GGF81544.1 hypothetical protein GCM10011375_40630 [Hymenobacter qilianensis]
MFYLRLPVRLRPHFQAELHAARLATARQDLPTAFKHLERAHILGQRWALPHTYTHLLMLRHGWRTGDRREILGQLPRIVFGFFMSLFGRVPTGNTGGANVSPEQPMPLPADLQHLLNDSV